jgi:hypothetical protein
MDETIDGAFLIAASIVGRALDPALLIEGDARVRAIAVGASEVVQDGEGLRLGRCGEQQQQAHGQEDACGWMMNHGSLRTLLWLHDRLLWPVDWLSILAS